MPVARLHLGTRTDVVVQAPISVGPPLGAALPLDAGHAETLCCCSATQRLTSDSENSTRRPTLNPLGP